jgi:hypothetical protein
MKDLTPSRPSSRPRPVLHRVLALPAAEQRLLVRCGFLLARAALLARLMPIGRIVEGIDARAAKATPPAVDASRALWLLEAVARRLRPRPGCLSAALAGYELLCERRLAARCVIGGRRGQSGFEAHAWLKAGDRILLGAPVTGYRAIWEWPSR